MKKSLQIVCAVATALTLNSNPIFAQTTNPAPYCVASYDEVEMYVPRYITEVKLGTMTNTTGDTHFAAPHYVYYNNVAAPVLEKGQSYTLSVGHDGSVAIHYLSAYIDFNGNNVFDLPEEMVFAKNIHDFTVTTSNPATEQFTVPANAISGTTRMRVMIYADDAYTWSQTTPQYLACTAFEGGFIDWGETEDYDVTISGGSAVSISKVDTDAAFRISPNPVSGFIVVPAAMKGSDIEILSVDGRRLLFENNVTADKIDISQLPAGTAIVRVVTNENVISQSIVIQ